MQKVDKDLVKQKFLEALCSYDEHASVQRLMGLELLRELKNYSPAKYGTALEIGSGSGKFTKYLNREMRFGKLYCNDLFEESYPFVEKWCKKENFLVLDAENAEKLPDNIDLLVSNATFQWFSDLPSFLNSVHGKLNTGATVAFTSFGSEQFKEIREITGNSLKYLVKDEFLKSTGSKYELVFFNEWIETMQFASVKRVLKHISATGVSGVAEKGIPIDFETFLNKYKEKFFAGEMYPLTYNPQIWILKAV